MSASNSSGTSCLRLATNSNRTPPFSDCIRLEKGVMVAEREGPYSWNGYDPHLNPAWMREWPESFLNETVMAERALNRATVLSRGLASPAALERNNGHGGSLAISFLDTNVIASSNSENTTGAIKELFAAMIFPSSCRLWVKFGSIPGAITQNFDRRRQGRRRS